LYALLDKKAKMPPDKFEALLEEEIGDKGIVGKVLDFMAVEDVRDIPRIESFLEDDSEKLNEVFVSLDQMKVGDYCVFDASIVRGLAYYTGVVFEVHDAVGELRAIGGGGRYDNLLHDFGGPSIAATGMGMGDYVLEILLREKGLLDKKLPVTKLDYFVACADRLITHTDMKIVARLRSVGYSAAFSYKTGNLSRQLKEASAQNAKQCIIIGQEFVDNNQLVVKDMTTGKQELVNINEFLGQLKS
jgi:histidyl-tRNA synthetase